MLEKNFVVVHEHSVISCDGQYCMSFIFFDALVREVLLITSSLQLDWMFQEHGCQMVFLVPKIPILVYFVRRWNIFVCILHGNLVFLLPFCILYGNFMVIWYLSRFGLLHARKNLATLAKS
jgi:hypothetical protein